MWQHIVPLNDLIEHNTDSKECACNPEIDFEYELVIHESMDRREVLPRIMVEQNNKQKGGIMQAYIGAKIILAEPMTEISFLCQFKGHGRKEVTEGMQTNERPGYHVIYSNPDGSKYNSWSPTEVFERSYRRIETDEKELISTY